MVRTKSIKWIQGIPAFRMQVGKFKSSAWFTMTLVGYTNYHRPPSFRAYFPDQALTWPAVRWILWILNTPLRGSWALGYLLIVSLWIGFHPWRKSEFMIFVITQPDMRVVNHLTSFWSFCKWLMAIGWVVTSWVTAGVLFCGRHTGGRVTYDVATLASTAKDQFMTSLFVESTWSIFINPCLHWWKYRWTLGLAQPFLTASLAATFLHQEAPGPVGVWAELGH